MNKETTYLTLIWPSIIKLINKIREIPYFLYKFNIDSFIPDNNENKNIDEYSIYFTFEGSCFDPNKAFLLLSCCDDRKLTIEYKEKNILISDKSFIGCEYIKKYIIVLNYKLNENTSIKYEVSINEKDYNNLNYIPFVVENITNIEYNGLDNMNVDNFIKSSFSEQEIDMFIDKINEIVKKHYDEENKIINKVMSRKIKRSFNYDLFSLYILINISFISLTTLL